MRSVNEQLAQVPCWDLLFITEPPSNKDEKPRCQSVRGYVRFASAHSLQLVVIVEAARSSPFIQPYSLGPACSISLAIDSTGTIVDPIKPCYIRETDS